MYDLNFLFYSLGPNFNEVASQHTNRWFEYSSVGLLSWCAADPTSQSKSLSFFLFTHWYGEIVLAAWRIAGV